MTRAATGIALLALCIGVGLGVAACGSGSSTTTVTVVTNASGGTSTETSTSGGGTSPAMTAASIKSLQAGLKSTGCYAGSVDGVSGPATVQALRAFQSHSGITADGLVGPNTTAKLLAAVSSGTKVCTTPARTPTPTASAPCTGAALMTALGVNSGKKINRYACAGGYAYAFVSTPAGPNGQGGFDYTQLFGTKNGTWVIVDRATQCSLVPKAIYAPACTTN
jgi:peptidoglycan hydrolase-like protein with peptidoglycan-binding domain